MSRVIRIDKIVKDGTKMILSKKPTFSRKQQNTWTIVLYIFWKTALTRKNLFSEEI